MKRRGFLGLIGLGIPATALASQIPLVESDVTSEIPKVEILDSCIPETGDTDELEENTIIGGFGPGKLTIFDCDGTKTQFYFSEGELTTTLNCFTPYRMERGVLESVYREEIPEASFQLYEIVQKGKGKNIREAIKTCRMLNFEFKNQFTILDRFMYESMEWDLKKGQIRVSGKVECNHPSFES